MDEKMQENGQKVADFEIKISKEDQERFVSEYGGVMDLVMNAIEVMANDHDLTSLNFFGGFVYGCLESAKKTMEGDQVH